jgi:hypothetical protein
MRSGREFGGSFCFDSLKPFGSPRWQLPSWPGTRKRRRPSTVIVVQSCPALQELLEQTLREAGDRVLVTRDPDEALEVARRVGVDVVVVDGEAEGLVRELSALQEGLHVVRLGPGLVSLSDVQRDVNRLRRSARRTIGLS